METLSEEHQSEIITEILDSGAGISTISEEVARSKGLSLTPSSSLAKLGDGRVVASGGIASVVFVFHNTDVLSESCRLSLECIGFNDKILISRVQLSSLGFRFFDSDPSDFGSWLITPSWRWFPLKISGGATVCEFQISSHDGALRLSLIHISEPTRPY